MESSKTMKTESLANSVNRHCLCQTMDKKILKAYLEKTMHFEDFIKSRPNLFSQTAVYISSEDLQSIKEIIKSVESVIKSKTFQDVVLNQSQPIAIKDYGPHGVFMGYDFHLTEDGPKLIEINTNAGGGFLNLILAKAQVACCEGIKQPFDLQTLESTYYQMFLSEWKNQMGDLPLNRIAIIDVDPKNQYLFPEFELFSQLFKKFEIDCLVLDPSELTFQDGGLWCGDKKVDLVYNRMTDFYFENENHVHIKQAYESGKVVITPNPHHHALFANKLNLEILSDQTTLTNLGIDSATIAKLIASVPKTIKLSHHNQEFLWKNKRNYFFKPAAGFGSKATYRGDKLTLKVWEEINRTNYVAQEIAKPGLRIVQVGEVQNALKLDIRAYSYDSKIQLLSSRLYMGQTTNFRTEGGGFAPVFLL